MSGEVWGIFLEEPSYHFHRAKEFIKTGEKNKAIPVITGSNMIFREGFQFHFNRAKEEFTVKNWKGAAGELKRCTAFISLFKAQRGERTGKEFSSALRKFRDLADQVEKGEINDIALLETGFNQVMKKLTPVGTPR